MENCNAQTNNEDSTEAAVRRLWAELEMPLVECSSNDRLAIWATNWKKFLPPCRKAFDKLKGETCATQHTKQIAFASLEALAKAAWADDAKDDAREVYSLLIANSPDDMKEDLAYRLALLEVTDAWEATQKPQTTNAADPKRMEWAADWRERLPLCRDSVRKLAVHRDGHLLGMIGLFAAAAYEAVAMSAWSQGFTDDARSIYNELLTYYEKPSLAHLRAKFVARFKKLVSGI